MTTVAGRIHISKTKPGLIGFDVGYHVNTSIHNRWVAIMEGGYFVGATICMNGSKKEHRIVEILDSFKLKLDSGGSCWTHDCKVIRWAQESLE